MKHRPALDGLRGVAVLFVIACHSSVPGLLGAGVVGVTMFFTLSGFLITALLVAEADDTGRISLPRFYLRRARRLLPALGFFLGITAALGATLIPEFFPWRELPSIVLYVANWRLLAGGLLGAWGHMWSLAVEEQFYLIWPVILMLALRARWRNLALLIALAGSLITVAERVYLWQTGSNWGRIYFASETHADALLLGCALALILHRSRPSRPRPLLFVPALACLLALSTVANWIGQQIIVTTLVPLVTVAIILSAVQDGYEGLLTSRMLQLCGRRSYALYLWHLPLAWFFIGSLPLPWVVSACAVLGCTWAMAWVSWRYVERPFVRVATDRGISSTAPTELLPSLRCASGLCQHE